MRELMSHHTRELVIVEQLQDALGCRNGRMLRVPAGCEGIRRGLGDHVDAGHRQTAALGQVGDEVVQAMTRTDRLRAIHRENDLVREPVRT